MGKHHRTDPPHPHPVHPVTAKYMDYLLNEAPRLRFIGGPEDGMEIVHFGKLPLAYYEMPRTSLAGIPVIERYEGDAADKDGLRLLYAGRRVDENRKRGGGTKGTKGKGRRRPPSR